MSTKEKILVVEDNDFVRMQISGFLKEEGYDVVESPNGDDALMKVGMHENIALALVDVRMEPIGGFEFLRSMKGFDYDIPAILVTGDDSPELLNDSQKHGAVAVLKKPVVKDRLIKTVERTLSRACRAS